jgi:hypothetical protein
MFKKATHLTEVRGRLIHHKLIQKVKEDGNDVGRHKSCAIGKINEGKIDSANIVHVGSQLPGDFVSVCVENSVFF